MCMIHSPSRTLSSSLSVSPTPRSIGFQIKNRLFESNKYTFRASVVTFYAIKLIQSTVLSDICIYLCIYFILVNCFNTLWMFHCSMRTTWIYMQQRSLYQSISAVWWYQSMWRLQWWSLLLYVHTICNHVTRCHVHYSCDIVYCILIQFLFNY